MRICVSIVEESVEGAARAVAEAKDGGADLVEVRFDLMPSLPTDLSPFKALDIPKIATLRTASQGGRFSGTERARLGLYQSCLRSGFDMVDLELGSPLLERRDRELRHAGVICSYHDHQGTPSPSSILERLVLASAKETLPKAAFQVRGAKDLLSIADAARLYSSTGKEFVLIGMGEMGELTRLRADRLGCAYTYASLAQGKEAAPGQLDLATMRSLSDDAPILGIIGHPLGHTLSPRLHHAALKEVGLGGRYLRLDVAPEELEDFLQVALEYDIRGFNVTIPHKEAIVPLLDRLDGSADKVGAVNTVLLQDGQLIGHNTDAHGVEMTFREMGVEAKGKKALVVGAGGAAKACCSFLSASGAKVSVYNRTRQRAEDLAKRFRGCRATDLESMTLERFDIVVNCTPLGMAGFPSGLPLPESVLGEGQFVMDTVYNPPETELLRVAKAKGALTANGERMLAHQALRSFSLWTGKDPGVEVMYRALREASG
ncbi:MAG: shikimate dehydrogenase [Methanomassiliicoccales archaeon]|nr:shikimate dehydrogenase [Methanomassiliicoccales archaeon]